MWIMFVLKLIAIVGMAYNASNSNLINLIFWGFVYIGIYIEHSDIRALERSR